MKNTQPNEEQSPTEDSIDDCDQKTISMLNVENPPRQKRHSELLDDGDHSPQCGQPGEDVMNYK